MFASAMNRGIIFQLLAVISLVTMAFVVKYLSATLSTIEIVFYRNIIGLTALITFIVLSKRYDLFKTKRPWMHFKRSLSGNMNAYFVFSAFALLPMTDATALLAAVPLVSGVLSILMLRENTNRASWGFIVLGMLGVVFLAQPTGNVSVDGLIMAFLAVFCTAWIFIQLREMGRTEQSLTTVFYYHLFGTVVTLPFILVLQTLPSQNAFILLAICSATGFVAQFLRTEASKLLPVFILTPMENLSLIWAAIYGYIFFGDIPQIHTAIGAAIIMTSSFLLIKYREDRSHLLKA